MPMAADENQTKQHHQVEKPSRPLNTWVVKMFLNELQASVNCSLMISTVSSLAPGGSATTGLSSCAKGANCRQSRSFTLYFKKKIRSLQLKKKKNHTAKSVRILGSGGSGYVWVLVHILLRKKRDSKGAKLYPDMCNQATVSKLHFYRQLP